MEFWILVLAELASEEVASRKLDDEAAHAFYALEADRSTVLAMLQAEDACRGLSVSIATYQHALGRMLGDDRVTSFRRQLVRQMTLACDDWGSGS